MTFDGAGESLVRGDGEIGLIQPHIHVVPASGKSAKITAQSTATVGEKSVSDSISSVRWSLGPNAQGTAGRFRISATHSDNVRWGVHNVVVKAVVTKARPGAV
jgi:hypothetical protein